MKGRFLSILKFFLALLLLPVVIGATVSFLENLRLMDRSIYVSFGWGVVVYLILHILLYQPAQVYDTGKKISEKALGFLSPLVKVAGFCVPIFTILSLFAYYLTLLIWKKEGLFVYFVFAAAFTFTMHLVFTANSLKGKNAGRLRENYFFSIFLVYIVNIFIIAGIFSFLSGDFNFLEFFRRSMIVAGAIYTASFKQLFEVRKK